MNELKISKKKVLEAASKCPTAKATLEVLFPEAFELDKYFNLRTLVIPGEGNRLFPSDKAVKAGFYGGSFMEVRGDGSYEGRAFYLSDGYIWEIVRDDKNLLCLIPTRKGQK